MLASANTAIQSKYVPDTTIFESASVIVFAALKCQSKHLALDLSASSTCKHTINPYVNSRQHVEAFYAPWTHWGTNEDLLEFTTDIFSWLSMRSRCETVFVVTVNELIVSLSLRNVFRVRNLVGLRSNSFDRQATFSTKLGFSAFSKSLVWTKIFPLQFSFESSSQRVFLV